MKKYILILITVVVLSTGGYFGYKYYQAQKSAQMLEACVQKFADSLVFRNQEILESEDREKFYYSEEKSETVKLFFLRDFCAENRWDDDAINKKIYTLSRGKKRNVKKLSFKEKPIHYQLLDIIKNNSTAYFPLKSALVRSCRVGKCSADEMKGLEYIHSLEGDYNSAEKIAASNCERHQTSCEKNVALTLGGVVKNGDGDPISSAKIEVLSDNSVTSVETDESGRYQIDFSSYDFVRVRIKATKTGYSDGVIPVNILTNKKERVYKNLDFTLNAPTKVVTLNNRTKTVSGKGASVENDNFVDVTPWSKYFIPFDALVHADGTLYRGEVVVYLFEFDKSTDMAQFMENDTFDEVVGYAGNIMKTFGMPYILFKTKEGETIHILKSNPMILQNKISEMEALRTAQDQVYPPLTEADLGFLVEQTQRGAGYPIDREFLIEHEMVRFPAFWVFDQVKGTWVNAGVKVLDTEGSIETLFYTISVPVLEAQKEVEKQKSDVRRRVRRREK